MGSGSPSVPSARAASHTRVVKPALAPETIIDNLATQFAQCYSARGDLEFMFCREIASARVTFDSLQRAVNSLNPFDEAQSRQLDRLSRMQTRYQRMETTALKELKDLQARRNILERFPDQTKDCAPLAEHTAFVGEVPFIKPIPAVLRGRLRSPLDHTPMRFSEPDAAKLAKGIPDIKRLVPDIHRG
jgi:hypothetical protein